MAKYVSSVKQVAYPQGSVFNKLADLNNFGDIKEKISDPANESRLNEIPVDKIGDVKQYIQSMEFSTDDLSVDVPGFGKLSLRIVERESDLVRVHDTHAHLRLVSHLSNKFFFYVF